MTKVVIALSTIQRAIDVVTSGSAGDVAPDPKIQIVKAMEQRWVDGEGGDVGGWVSATCWMGSSRGGSVVSFLRDWLGVNSKLRKWNVQDWAVLWIDLQEMWVVQMGFRFIRI
ncbi:hypothetical protein F0562_011079 [Nyssa sinensis]|uniref:Uncharacterized protein n=1 Tax=Nyssa sinensis TaxID=561372 RepID=A0A5J5A3N1_9ASTE|nr:hypothetical protein F0562_011079 [Nyssa sinensis]